MTRRRTSTGARFRSRRSGRGHAVRGRGRLWIALLVIVAVLGALGLWSSRLSRPSHPAADPRGYIRLARSAELAGDYDRALAIYREALTEFPGDPLLMGFEATTISNRSFAVRSNRGRSVPVLATSHERVQDALRAIALYDSVGHLLPRHPEPPLQTGVLYAVWGLPEDALYQFYRATQLGDRSETLQNSAVAITLLQLGKTAPADSLILGPTLSAPADSAAPAR